MKQSPRKALIPVAGRGTRFLPATKTVAKELFPLVDKPQLLLIVEEAVGAGVEEIILISGPHKKAVEDFFKVDAELEDFLQSKGELDLVERLKKISSLAIIKIAQQDDPKGLGHAVYSGKKLIGNEPFYVLLGDEIIYSPEDSSLALRDLQQSFIETKASTVTLMKVPKEQVNRYGIADVKDPSFVPQKISSLIEKPSVEESPSQWA
ncbi:MAG: UTP--glucose-1-phosphate uridylyltransferase, partial [Bdellovibrionales bacterium]|nr:UTP--glucose-1-phosphate uridylyltransferase [Bdellovibrionales bacterium]